MYSSVHLVRISPICQNHRLLTNSGGNTKHLIFKQYSKRHIINLKLQLNCVARQGVDIWGELQEVYAVLG